jgi:hypothetical protein
MPPALLLVSCGPYAGLILLGYTALKPHGPIMAPFLLGDPIVGFVGLCRVTRRFIRFILEAFDAFMMHLNS